MVIHKSTRLGRPPIEWDEVLDKALKDLRANGHNTLSCADYLGISHQAVAARMRVLGINKRIYHKSVQ